MQTVAKAAPTRGCRANFNSSVPQSISKSHSSPLLEIPALLVSHGNPCSAVLTSAPGWSGCIRPGAPCGWSWSRPRRGSRRGRWPEPRGRTASCPERHRCSRGRRGRSGRSRSPSRCWWPEAAGRGRRSRRSPCGGFLGREEIPRSAWKHILWICCSPHTVWGDVMWQGDIDPVLTVMWWLCLSEGVSLVERLSLLSTPREFIFRAMSLIKAQKLSSFLTNNW